MKVPANRGTAILPGTCATVHVPMFGTAARGCTRLCRYRRSRNRMRQRSDRYDRSSVAEAEFRAEYQNAMRIQERDYRNKRRIRRRAEFVESLELAASRDPLDNGKSTKLRQIERSQTSPRSRGEASSRLPTLLVLYRPLFVF